MHDIFPRIFLKRLFYDCYINQAFDVTWHIWRLSVAPEEQVKFPLLHSTQQYTALSVWALGGEPCEKSTLCWITTFERGETCVWILIFEKRQLLSLMMFSTGRKIALWQLEKEGLLTYEFSLQWFLQWHRSLDYFFNTFKFLKSLENIKFFRTLNACQLF